MIELGWPAKALSPNFRSRSHWPKTRALKAARFEGAWATRAALPGYQPAAEPLPILVTAYPPDRRDRDDDNLIASFKPFRDGIADALGIDDKLFRPKFQWGEPVKGGKIVVVLG